MLLGSKQKIYIHCTIVCTAYAEKCGILGEYMKTGRCKTVLKIYEACTGQWWNYMSFTGAYVSLKWFRQQQAFSDSKSQGLPTALLCPFRVPIILGLVFLVFFSFPISSDLKPGRITSTCLSAISTLTLSFWMRIARQIPRDSLQVLHNDRIKQRVVAILFLKYFFI